MWRLIFILMKYIYGPVNSRRLGLSLGLSLMPHKICNFDCIYCQLGKTKEKASQRKEYLKISEVIEELKSWLVNNSEIAKKLDYITFSGLGEPTLNINIGAAIAQVKALINRPVAVITNASLLDLPEVRHSLLNADLIVPSFDAVVPEMFAKIDRPHADIKIENIIAGLTALRKEFKGKIWLEVMLVKGLNDDIRHIKKLKEIADRINPDKIQVNSPVRTTTEDYVFPADQNKLAKIKKILGDKCEII